MRTGSLVGINFLEILVCSKDRVHAYYIVEGQILVRSSLRFSFAYRVACLASEELGRHDLIGGGVQIRASYQSLSAFRNVFEWN
jgi:hypothetical protein